MTGRRLGGRFTCFHMLLGGKAPAGRGMGDGGAGSAGHRRQKEGIFWQNPI